LDDINQEMMNINADE